jgi:hypothetical protein
MEFTACHPFGAKNFDLVSTFSEHVYTPGIILVYGKYLPISVTWGGGRGDGQMLPNIFFCLRIFFGYRVYEGQVKNWVESGGNGRIYIYIYILRTGSNQSFSSY